MPLPVGYQASSTKNSFDYAMVVNSDEEYPRWRALWVEKPSKGARGTIEIPHDGGSQLFTVNPGQILYVRATSWMSDFSNCGQVIALY